MFTKTKLLLIVVALFISSGVAKADGPMVLTTVQMDNVTAGGGFRSFTEINKYFNIDERIREDKFADFYVTTFVRNNSAVAEGEADAEGRNTDAQTFTFAQTNSFLSTSASKSIALTDGGGACQVCQARLDQ